MLQISYTRNFQICLDLEVTLLYCSTQKEAKEIMREAKEAGLTKQTYVWIVTQPVIGSDLDLAPQVGVCAKYQRKNY